MITYKEYVKSRVVNNEKLKKLENTLGEKIPRDLLKKAIDDGVAEEFMRPYYCRELKQNMTNISVCDKINDKGIDIVKFDGEKFTMLVSVLGAYSHDGELDFKPRENGSKTLATSLITDEFLGHYSSQDKDLIVLGYTNISDDSLYLCGPQDLCSLHDDGTYQRRDSIMGVNYLPSRQMARQTSSIYNEYALLRKNSKGEELLPTCVVAFHNEIDEKTKKFAGEHNLPIVLINWEKYKEIQHQKLLDFEEQDNPTTEDLEKYLYGVVAYYEELICYNLEKENAITWSDCFDIMNAKINTIQERLAIDKNSQYWTVYEKFIRFQQSTRNDAIGRVLASQIFRYRFAKLL